MTLIAGYRYPCSVLCLVGTLPLGLICTLNVLPGVHTEETPWRRPGSHYPRFQASMGAHLPLYEGATIHLYPKEHLLSWTPPPTPHGVIVCPPLILNGCEREE